MYSKAVEQTLVDNLHRYEKAKQRAEEKIIEARHQIEEADQAIAHWQFALDDYRKASGQPTDKHYISPTMEQEYGRKTPTELVEHWANKHDGEVVVKELTRVGLRVGAFKKYRNGASSIYSVLKRRKYEKVGPGHFRKPLNQNGNFPRDTSNTKVWMELMSGQPK